MGLSTTLRASFRNPPIWSSNAGSYGEENVEPDIQRTVCSGSNIIKLRRVVLRRLEELASVVGAWPWARERERGSREEQWEVYAVYVAYSVAFDAFEE